MAKKDTFNNKVSAAVEALQHLTNATGHYSDVRDERPSGRGMRLLACRAAGIPLGEDETLSKRCESLELGPHIQHAIGEVMRRFAETDIGHGAMIDPPTSNFGALWRGSRQDQQNANVGLITECLTIGVNPLQVIAVATYRAAVASPDSFGRFDDLAAEQRKRRDLEAKIDKLCAEVSAEWDVSHVDIHPIPRTDTARILFKLGMVSAIPREGSGRRLVEHLAAAQAAKAA